MHEQAPCMPSLQQAVVGPRGSGSM